MKKVLIIVGVVVALGVIIFYLFTQYSQGGVEIKVNVPTEEVEAGRPFDVDVTFSNNTGGILGDVRVTLDPSDQILFADDGNKNVVIRKLGEISNGSTHKETFKVLALPGEEPTYKVVATIFYSPASLVAEFKKKEEVEIRVKRPDFELTLEVPEKVFSGEEFDIKTLYERDDELPETAEFEVHIDYPEGFEIERSNPEEIDRTTDGVRFKNLGEVEKNGNGEVLLRGRVEMPDSSEFQIKARLVMKFFGEEYTFLSETKNVLIEPSPLSFQVVLAEHGPVIKPDDQLTYVLTYKNNTEVALKDVVINAGLAGEMFDFSTLTTDGRFNNFERAVTWDSSKLSQLREVRAGESGSVSFSVHIREKHPIQRLNDKNFILVVDARIESPTVPYLINSDKTLNTSRIENRVAGLIGIDVGGYFRDAKSGIVNTGPFPPRVGISTRYTIHWNVTNYGTDVDGIEVRAKLGEGVTFTGNTGGNTDNAPKLDSSTGEVVWQVGRLLATTGVISEKPEAIFQVEARPSGANIGNYMTLIEETRITGRDEFTDITITGTDLPATTRLPDDNTVSQNDGKVIQ